MAVAEVQRTRGTASWTRRCSRFGHAQASRLHSGPDGETLGQALIQIREAGIDPLEAVFATGVRRFDESGEYKAAARSC